MRTNTTLSTGCVSAARVHCADPESTMLCTDKLAKYLRRVTAWGSAGQLHSVFVAMSALFLRIAGPARFYTLASCSMFVAQTTRVCFDGAPFE